MSNHRDDLMNSGDARDWRFLKRLAHHLGLDLIEEFDTVRMTSSITITSLINFSTLIHKEFALRDSIWNINCWIHKQLNDYQSWR